MYIYILYIYRCQHIHGCTKPLFSSPLAEVPAWYFSGETEKNHDQTRWGYSIIQPRFDTRLCLTPVSTTLSLHYLVWYKFCCDWCMEGHEIAYSVTQDADFTKAFFAFRMCGLYISTHVSVFSFTSLTQVVPSLRQSLRNWVMPNIAMFRYIFCSEIYSNRKNKCGECE